MGEIYSARARVQTRAKHVLSPPSDIFPRSSFLSPFLNLQPVVYFDFALVPWYSPIRTGHKAVSRVGHSSNVAVTRIFNIFLALT